VTAELGKARDEHAAAKQEAESLRQAAASGADATRAEADTLRTDLAAAKAAHDEVSAELAKAREAHAAAEAAREQAAAELAKAHEAHAAAQANTGELDELRAALDAEKKDAARLAAELDGVRNQEHELHDRVTSLEKDLAREHEVAAGFDEQKAALEKQVKAETSRADDERALRRSAEESTHELHDKIATLEKQVAAAPAAGTGAAGSTGNHDPAVGESVNAINDSLAELRSSLRAASDETAVMTEPANSVRVVTDALSSATEQIENARANLRTLSKLLGSAE
jgi:chromosome segregation ATPase